MTPEQQFAELQTVLEAVRKTVREAYGRHYVVHAPDGGCCRCPLAVDDPIHVEAVADG